MRLADRLVSAASDFRRDDLGGSSDSKDGTVLPPLWEDHEVEERDPDRGGDYLCVHLRRKDYVRSREGQVRKKLKVIC